MFRKNKLSCYFEEICLINFYGTPSEKHLLQSYLNMSTDDMGELFSIAVEIKKRISKKK
ncbi:hypothetical protein KAJ27_03760 [bacterium]|nr:hypothetical protein [bacterium]